MSPLKISFWYGSDYAPDDVKEAIDHKYGDECPVTIPEHCVLLEWRDAFATLNRTPKEWYEFHPEDLDWQVNGWLMERDGSFPLSLLTDEEIAHQGNHWPHLPANPTTTDFAAEVMIPYYGDIQRMSYDQIMARYMEAGRPYSLQLEAAAQKAHQTHYLQLTAGLDAWTDPALTSLNHSQKTKTNRINQRMLYKRAYQVAYQGKSDIDPLEAIDIGDTTLLDFTLKRGLIPGTRTIKLVKEAKL